MVKGSGSVGMWSTCKVVHHVHAVGALVHQAEQARSLNARLRVGGRNAGDPYSSREAGNTLAGRGAACGSAGGVRKGAPGAAAGGA